MVNYIRSDLDFILKQIKIAEAHSSGQPLYGTNGLIPTYNLSWGLRTVDGSYNNLLPGREYWGAADQPFPAHVDPSFSSILVDHDRNPATPMITLSYDPTIDPDGPGPRVAGDMIDPYVRMISNLTADQTLDNPAAIISALSRNGIEGDLIDIAGQIKEAYERPLSGFGDRSIEQLFKAVDDATDAAAEATASAAVNPTPENIAAAAAAQAALDAARADLAGARATDPDGAGPAQSLDALLTTYGIELSGANVVLPNVAPDEGLSAPFNSWFTLFGQFFDHGLDLVAKGGSGQVMIPLAPDDPLYVPGSSTNFMVLTRATLDENGNAINLTTPFVDQNQTYSSHPSHQVFLRAYEMGPNGPEATGELIHGVNGGMATWGELKVQARNLLGIDLRDTDVGNLPLLRTDPYGNFIPGANGLPQVVIGIGSDGIPNTADDLVVEGNLATPLVLAELNGGLGPVRTGHAFLDDIAHNAVPDGLEDGDTEVGGNIPADGTYDDELLDAHYVAGDGRANENIGLTAVHHVFHAEHNRLVQHTKDVVIEDARQLLANGASMADAVAFLNEWLDVDVAAVPMTPGAVAALDWDGERIFQAAKFGTEMQYQHLVFEEFARKVQPAINPFLVPDGYDATMNPTIMAEFAHVVYRFGHSMLNEDIDRFDVNFAEGHISLIQGFLNPIEFDPLNPTIAAGDIVRGMTRQVGNQIDEFVTSALRNNLLGLPLDLATINLARGRDAGVPTLNEARREFYAVTDQAAELKPYESWVDFAGNLKNEASIINFIASYGTHSLITGQTTAEGRRDAALTIITGNSVGGLAVPADAVDFLNAQGAWAGGSLGGLENVDFWIGGLAEKTMPFGGMLGSTFNFVFEVQMEALQSGDRFYYLQRLDGLHLFGELEANSFASMIMRHTDAVHLPSDVFSAPAWILEVDQSRQFNDSNGDGVFDNLDPLGGGILTPLIVRNNPSTAGPDSNYLRYTGGDHVVLGGTEANDILQSGIGDDTIYGDGGNDRIEGDFGNDILNGGDGDDIIRDRGGDDNIKGGDGNDAIHAGPGLDLVLAGAGQDFVVLGTDAGSEVFGGEGDDFILGNKNAERILGNEGNDWLETGTFDGAPGDNFDEIFAEDAINGHDVFLGDGGFDEFIGEGGNDIMVGSLGRGKMAGMSGFDWATYKDFGFGVNADLSIPIVFDESPTLPPNTALDEFESMEGLSGSRFNDVLKGSHDTAADRLPTSQGGTSGFQGSILTADGIALISGLQQLLGAGVTSFSAGDIILGGDGSDLIQGNGGNDLIDGDRWLDVQIGVYATADKAGAPIRLVSSMKELTNDIFSGAINPNQLGIVRSIKTDSTAGDVDVAVFSGNRADYNIGAVNGRLTVTHARGTQVDGVDTLLGIERLRFADMEISTNSPATGAPVISDPTPTAGQALTVNTAAIADAQGLGAFSYQWRSSADGITWTNIAGATLATFTPTNAAGMAPDPQQGLRLSVVVRFTDGFGNPESVTSAATGPVGANWAGDGGSNQFTGTAGDDIASGNGGADTLNGFAGNDLLNGGGGNDIVNGGDGNDTLNGGDNSDTLTGGNGNDDLNGGDGNDTAVFAGASTAYTFGEAGSDLVITAVSGLEGTDTVGNDVEVIRLNGVNYNVLAGNGSSQTLTGNATNQIILGRNGADVINGAGGNDIILGGAGADSITQSAANAGADFVDGGAGADTYTLVGTAAAETFDIMTRAAAEAAGVTGLHASTEIVIRRNGVLFAELDNIEEIVVNGTVTTTNTGDGVVNGGNLGGDTVNVIGDFTQTSLDYSTITVNGGRGADTVDISRLSSDHRLVFNTNGGSDEVIGSLRPQDVVNGSANGFALDLKALGVLGRMREMLESNTDYGSSGRLQKIFSEGWAPGSAFVDMPPAWSAPETRERAEIHGLQFDPADHLIV
ncbi:peroxidase family protein [Sphingomonas sp. LHG3406-1]|uniref:peroxidase family protein n=1 Tax=Sphingomonas sp. LHG3406-1 TaxID=2804617 RepID=UPI0026330D14|nr:peroxidase family protein [Sphingomonas sp. LHG3406-1]